MAITWFQQKGMTANAKWEKGIKDYKLPYQAHCTAGELIDAVMGDGGVPFVLGSPYPTNSQAKVIDWDIKLVENSAPGVRAWDVTFHFSTEIPIEQDQEPNPLDRPPIIKTSRTQEDAPFEMDLDGEPVINSAAQPFKQVPTTKKGVLTIHIEKNYAPADFTIEDEWNLEDTINLNAYTIDGFAFPAQSLLMRSVSRSPGEENGVSFLKVDFEILVHDGTTFTDDDDEEVTLYWFPRLILDAGFQAWSDDETQLLQVNSDDGGSGVEALLDGAGHKAPINVGTGRPDPSYLGFREYEEVAWEDYI